MCAVKGCFLLPLYRTPESDYALHPSEQLATNPVEMKEIAQCHFPLVVMRDRPIEARNMVGGKS